MKQTKLKDTEIGQIPEDWDVKNLGDIAQPISSTYDFSGKEKVVFINTGDILAGHFLHKDYSKITLLPGQAKKRISKNDILFSEIRPINKRYAFVDFEDTEDYVVSTKLMVIRAKEDVLPKYLYRILIAKNTLLEFQHIAESRSGTFPQITFDAIRYYQVFLPSFNEQTTITKILSDLDAKIELNQEMNTNLETVGQALFKHWFVDFEFPNKKGKPYKSSGGKMVDSELGRIPNGWKIKSIDEVADFLNGLALQKFPAENEEDYLPVIKIRELKQGITDSSDRANKNIPREYIVSDGDVLFSWSGSLEVVIWVGGEGALNQHLFKVTSKEYPKWFYYYWTLKHLPEYRHIAEGKATTMGHIQRHHLKSSLVLVPDEKRLPLMDKMFSQIIDKQVRINQEIINLSQIRDSLLPRLMSGKIRVGVN